MCLPKVMWVTPEQMKEEMGSPYFSARYDPLTNDMWLNQAYPLRFSTLFHDMVHWALCLLPKTSRVHEANLLFDRLWEDCRRWRERLLTPNSKV